MLNKPKFMTPSTNMITSTIDATADKIPFSCIVDGNEAISAWQIIIYNLIDNSSVFDTGKVDLLPPFFPIDTKNRNVVFEKNLKDYLGDNTAFCNKSDAYYWTITFWGTSGSKTTSCEEVFYANSMPSIEILFRQTSNEEFIPLEDTSVISNKACTFKAVYAQENADGTSVPLKRYGWRLSNASDGSVLLDTITHNHIYGVQDNMVLDYDGFLTNNNYSIELYVETQNNVSVYSSPIIFPVEYITTFLSGDFKVETLKKESGIMLDWSESVVAGGKMYDGDGNLVSIDDVPYMQNYPIVEYAYDSESKNYIPNGTTSVLIPENSSIVYDYGANFNLDISEDSYIVLSTQLTESEDRLLFDIEGVDDSGEEIFRRLSFVDNSFEYIVLGDGGRLLTKQYAITDPPSQNVWYVITMSPILMDENGEAYIKLTVAENKASGALYPSKQLYPSTTRYPRIGSWETVKVGEA